MYICFKLLQHATEAADTYTVVHNN